MNKLLFGNNMFWLLSVIIVLVLVLLLKKQSTAAPADQLNPAQTPPLRLGIVGVVHGHVRGFFERSKATKNIQIVGIAEPNKSLADNCASRYQLDPNLFYSTLEQMLDKAKPQAVAAFTSTFDHTRIVETCASRGIHVMMEKPLAVNMEHARAIQQAARKGNIQVLVNYETTWHRSNQAAYSIACKQNALGDIRKIVVHDGHRGPKEIGCPPEFLEWLTDPVLNGGGALTDFGCYGADLSTWLMDGRRPISVTAVTQQIKPDVYPKVDDEATIVLTYPKAQTIIQASWNWPFDRKDMEVYGQSGYVQTLGRDSVRLRLANQAEKQIAAETLESPFDEPLAYLAAVVNGKIKPSGLSSLEVNMIVTEILDAARQSAASGKTILLESKSETK